MFVPTSLDTCTTPCSVKCGGVHAAWSISSAGRHGKGPICALLQRLHSRGTTSPTDIATACYLCMLETSFRHCIPAHLTL